MNINLDTEGVFSLINENLKNKKPLSITRIGDGELFVLNEGIKEDLTLHTYKRQLGFVPDQVNKNIIKENLLYSIENSDILSINPKGDKKIGWDSVVPLYNHLSYNNKKLWESKLFCDHDVHHFFLNQNYFDKLFSIVDEITIISSRDIVDKLKSKYDNIKTVNFFKIPGEYMFEENKYESNYFPEIYNKIYNQISNMDCSGKLLLLGGGFVGKKLGVKFKESGGVSFDIGSVFDLWVGKLTRGKNKGVFSYTEPQL